MFPRLRLTSTSVSTTSASLTHRTRKMRHLAFAGLILALSACSKPDTPEALIADAQAYQAKGDTKAAIIQLKNALNKSPDNAQARLQLGALHIDSGDPASAEKELRKALALGSNRAIVLPQLARALLDTGRTEDLLEETKNDSASSAPLLALRGSALLALKRIPEAHRSFDQAVALDPKSIEGAIGLAKCALIENDGATATRISDQLVVTSPKIMEVWLLRGDLLRLSGRAVEALAAYAEAVKLQPNNVSVRLLKANLEITTQKFADAKIDIDAAEKVVPNTPVVKYTQALLEFNEKKFTAALDTIQQVLRVAPENMPSLLLAGSIHYSLDSFQQAEQNLKKYVDRSPDDLYARKLLAATLLRMGQAGRALDVLAPALAKQIPDAPLLLLASDCYMALKDYKNANDNIAKAQRVAPENALVQAALGMVKLARGDNQDGIAELEKAAALDDRTPQIGMLLITAHMKAQEWDKALAATKAMEKIDPQNPLTYNLQGGIYLNKGDNQRARESFDKALLIQPGFAVATVNLAKLDVTEKKPEAAAKRLEALLVTDAKNTTAMSELANIAIAGGKLKDARAWLEKAVERNPDSVPALSALANFYFLQGLKKEALSLVAKAQTNFPDNKEILDLLAQSQAIAGDPAAALQSYNKLAASSPASIPLQMRIASTQLALKNVNASKEALTKALQVQPDNASAQIMLGLLETKSGNTDAALGIARTLQTTTGSAAAGFGLEGTVMNTRKNAAGALKAFERAFALNPNSAYARQLHDALLQNGRKKEADAKIAQWLVQQPNDNITRIYLADVDLKNGRSKEAAAQLEIVLKTEATNIVALNNLAWAYQLDKDPRARGLAERALLIAPDDPPVLDTVGVIYLQAGEVARSVELLKRAATRAPDMADVRLHLAQALAKSGDNTGAKTELEIVIKNNKSPASVAAANALLKQL